jgi:hypothetical protein
VKKVVLGILFLMGAGFIVSAPAMEHTPNTIIFNGSLGIGTFSAGEHDDGSVFLGGSLSADWIPNGKTGLSYGLESGLLGGETQDTVIFGIPIIFRLGWYPSFIKLKILTFLFSQKLAGALEYGVPGLIKIHIPMV